MCTQKMLGRLRGQLDDVDQQILNLIDQRLSICSQIGDAKRADGELKLRPKRQREIVEHLSANAAVASPELISDVWRELMGHSLQLQSPTKFLLVRNESADRFIGLIRQGYGSAAPVEWVQNYQVALDRSVREDAIAVLPASLEWQLPQSVAAFDLLGEEHGSQALLIGRVDPTDVPDPASERAEPYWRPDSWRSFPARQQPQYADRSALSSIEHRLAQRAPIVELADIEALRKRLAEVSAGDAIVIQAGDCAETFAAHSKAIVRMTAVLLESLALLLEEGSRRPVTCIGRLAGQYAKPRSNLTENIAGREMPSYRGDAINGFAATVTSRTVDPARLLEAQERSAKTARWLSHHVPDGGRPIYTSHEALLLNYEQTQIHFDELSGRWWSGSGHMLWIGDRTRQLDGAHAEFVRGITNPIGIKVGPTAEPSELLRLMDLIDPGQEVGRLILIPRMGCEIIQKLLPPLMRQIRRAGRKPIWLCDPMHGNTQQAGGYKTRHFNNVARELKCFFEISAAEAVWPGGVHLEITPDDVTECMGGAQGIAVEDLARRYETACDPRLNEAQAMELAELISKHYRTFLHRGAASCE